MKTFRLIWLVAKRECKILTVIITDILFYVLEDTCRITRPELVKVLRVIHKDPGKILAVALELDLLVIGSDFPIKNTVINLFNLAFSLK